MYQRSGLPWTKYWDFILLDMLSMVLSMVAAYYVYIPTDFNLTKSPEYMMLLLGMLALCGCGAIVVEESEPVWIGCAADAQLFT